MTPEKWKEAFLTHVTSCNSLEFSADDQRALFSALSAQSGLFTKALCAAFISSFPSAASVLTMDLSSTAAIQNAARVQGRASGMISILESLADLAAGSLGEQEDSAHAA